MCASSSRYATLGLENLPGSFPCFSARHLAQVVPLRTHVVLAKRSMLLVLLFRYEMFLLFLVKIY